MSSAEFVHGTYTIKTFLRNGECRARAFHNGAWLRHISDWTATTVDEAVHRMRTSLDALQDDDDADAQAPAPVAPFLSQSL
jgi:hypothetical protein